MMIRIPIVEDDVDAFSRLICAKVNDVLKTKMLVLGELFDKLRIGFALVLEIPPTIYNQISHRVRHWLA